MIMKSIIQRDPTKTNNTTLSMAENDKGNDDTGSNYNKSKNDIDDYINNRNLKTIRL